MSKFVIKPKSIFSKKEYEIFDEAGKSLYYIKYKWKWKYIDYDSDVHDEVIYVHERRDLVNGYITSVYIRHKLLGEIEFGFGRGLSIGYKGWEVYGTPSNWNYMITNVVENPVVTVSNNLGEIIVDVDESVDDLTALATVVALSLVGSMKSEIF